MIDLKEHKFPYESFIGGWYLPEKICDDIIEIFKNNKQYWEPGRLGYDEIDPKRKESTDISISIVNSDYPFNDYKKYLFQIKKNYEVKYQILKDFLELDIENYNIQHYKPKQGFKIWHCERSAPNHRVLVFMTYLNDVEDGGTEFFYQKLTTPAKKGLTLIWPTDFTHTHKGQISEKHEKFIVTGWFKFKTQ